MGRYIQQSDIESVFGTDNVSTWSNLQNTGAAADTARVAAAIDYAEASVEDRFRSSSYAVPFVGIGVAVPVVLKDWMTKLAGIWLYESRGWRGKDEDALRFGGLASQVELQMDSYLSGQRRLQAQRNTERPTAPAVAW
jgi:hypothetical protein